MPKSPLDDLQKRFVDAVLDGKGEGLLAARVRGGGRLSSREALAVYRRGYAARLSAALGETFEACWWVLGDDSFLAAGRAFLESNPSSSHNLSDYGAEFPAFLGGLPEAKDLPFLAELAAFEWEFKELFHAAEEAPAAPEETPEGPLFRLPPQARLRSHAHRVYEVWKLRGSGDQALPRGLWEGPERLLLSKRSGQVGVWKLGAAEHALLQALAAGRPLGRALDETLALHPGLDEARIAGLFGALAEAGAARAAA